MVTYLALGKSCDYHSSAYVTLGEIGKSTNIDPYRNKTNQNANHLHHSYDTR